MGRTDAQTPPTAQRPCVPERNAERRALEDFVDRAWRAEHGSRGLDCHRRSPRLGPVPGPETAMTTRISEYDSIVRRSGGRAQYVLIRIGHRRPGTGRAAVSTRSRHEGPRRALRRGSGAPRRGVRALDPGHGVRGSRRGNSDVGGCVGGCVGRQAGRQACRSWGRPGCRSAAPQKCTGTPWPRSCGGDDDCGGGARGGARGGMRDCRAAVVFPLRSAS